MQKKRYSIDGNDFSNLSGFYDVVSRTIIPNSEWGRNLDAFNDILRGGFGTPEEGFTIIWKNAKVSKERLGYEETENEMKRALHECHPTNREIVQERIRKAQMREGETIYDWLIEIIEDHGPNGDQKEDQVELILD
ncbi:barstar family protein [Pelagicoccus enzymogenes]|uniref:barstar family protein n=1 Tax=Pelagicoccus enzymogenes TaxID=2773457 RepID=UPI00280D33F6|nr:barstar family protein [Pelagicoccus enzymogenes]MDQ8201292.1 barstar family protein [Pelagicoccus enzymogenes]